MGSGIKNWKRSQNNFFLFFIFDKWRTTTNTETILIPRWGPDKRTSASRSDRDLTRNHLVPPWGHKSGGRFICSRESESSRTSKAKLEIEFRPTPSFWLSHNRLFGLQSTCTWNWMGSSIFNKVGEEAKMWTLTSSESFSSKVGSTMMRQSTLCVYNHGPFSAAHFILRLEIPFWSHQLNDNAPHFAVHQLPPAIEGGRGRNFIRNRSEGI